MLQYSIFSFEPNTYQEYVGRLPTSAFMNIYQCIAFIQKAYLSLFIHLKNWMETLWGPEIKASLLYFNMGMYTHILYNSLKKVKFVGVSIIYIIYIQRSKGFHLGYSCWNSVYRKKESDKIGYKWTDKRMNVNVAKYQIALSWTMNTLLTNFVQFTRKISHVPLSYSSIGVVKAKIPIFSTNL